MDRTNKLLLRARLIRYPMKMLMCCLAVMLSAALSGSVPAAETTDREKITGTVISVDHKQDIIVIDTGKHDGQDKFEIILVDVKAPKVGEKVTAYCWYHNRGRFCTDKIEKLSK
jgi:hypothetical protein